MTTDEIDAKQRILQATIDLLNEEPEIDKITIRRIAAKAGVGIGLINYHFRNRETLLKEAVDQITGQAAATWLNPSFDASPVPPTERLRSLLKGTSDVIASYPQFSEISVSYALYRSELGVQKMILPLLREIFGMSKSELELRLYAMMIISALQVALLQNEAFQAYVGLNLFEKSQRDQCIDVIVDTILMNKEK